MLARCVLAGILTSTSIARADDEAVRARALFDEAGELERQARWTSAQERLQLALRLRETPHLHYALGWALENDDKLLEARTEYESASRLAQRGSVEEVARLSTQRLAELAKTTPIIRVRVPHGGLNGTRVIVDGRAVSVRDDAASMPVNPGARVVRIERGGRAPTERVVYLSRGMVHVVDLDADDERHDGVTTTPASVATPRREASMLPFVLVGGGAALVLGGGALLVSSTSDANQRDESQNAWCAATACTGGTTATRPETAEAEAHRRDAVEASDRGNVKQALGIGLGIAGLISAGVGTWMLVHDDGDRREPMKRVAVTAAPIAGGAFAGATLRF